MTIAGVFNGATRWWLLAAAVTAHLIVVGLGVAFIRLSFFCDAVCRGKEGKMQVALTFDDGPDPDATPLVIEALEQLKIAACFFCVGQKALANPHLTRRIHDSGHLLGNHTFRHKWWTNFLFGKYLASEIEQTQSAIETVAGVSPVFFRPPMGLTNPHFSRILKKAGLTVIGWTVRSLDRTASAPQPVVDRIINKTRDGSIILLHDGGVRAELLVEIVQQVVAKLRQRGYAIVRLDRLLSRET